LRVRKLVREFRRNSRSILGRAIARLIGPRKYADGLATEDIFSVLICRINGRLGNTVFLTPLIRRVHEQIPHASIDLAVSYPHAGELFRNFPGVRHLIAFPHKGPGLIPRYLAALRRIRAQRYDLVIDPVAESTGGRIVTTLCRARYRAGFAAKSQWAPLTHAIPEPDVHMHQALLPVFLLSQVIGQSNHPTNTRLSLCLRPDEVESGRAAVSRAIAHVTGDQFPSHAPSARVFGFFAHAAGLKAVERTWWVEFWRAFLELDPAAIPLEFLPSPPKSVLDARFASMHCPSPRAMTAAIAATRMFISADTGPMHLASSTPVPTVALFRASNPALYGPLKDKDAVINITENTPQLVARYCQRLWRASLTESAPIPRARSEVSSMTLPMTGCSECATEQNQAAPKSA
jgi:heptosyltransferase III